MATALLVIDMQMEMAHRTQAGRDRANPLAEAHVADLLTLFRARGLPVVALTDRPGSPLARLSDAVLLVPEVDFGAFRSLSATITLALTLAVAIGAGRG